MEWDEFGLSSEVSATRENDPRLFWSFRAAYG